MGKVKKVKWQTEEEEKFVPLRSRGCEKGCASARKTSAKRTAAEKKSVNALKKHMETALTAKCPSKCPIRAALEAERKRSMGCRNFVAIGGSTTGKKPSKKSASAKSAKKVCKSARKAR